uniref:ATP-dependent RNA helicase DRS1 n=1 Tax=Lygus hesperus TaxID=30085 RepID=A0A0A9Y289_LYGHE
MYSMIRTLRQEFILLQQYQDPGMVSLVKQSIVVSLCRRLQIESGIIFTRTRRSAHHLYLILRLLNFSVCEYHGDLQSNQRCEIVQQFRDNKYRLMVCTDIASRGLDIQTIELIINMDMPYKVQSYIHRVGRTARRGRTGVCISLVTPDDVGVVKSIYKLASSNKLTIHRREIDAAILEKYTQVVTSLQDSLRTIERCEGEAKELKLAEMEANKATNLLLHMDEIHSKPRRMWHTTRSSQLDARKREKQLLESSRNAILDPTSINATSDICEISHGTTIHATVSDGGSDDNQIAATSTTPQDTLAYLHQM